MKPGNKIIDKIVGEVIRDGQPGRIIVEGRDLLDVLSERPKNNSPQKEPDQKKDTGFFKRVWEKIQKKCTWLKWVKVRLEAPGNRGLHFSLALAIAFMMLVVSVWYGIFFIKDVILYETEFTTNEQGAIVPKKPLGGEYVLYLFNTSDIWANPGIQVNKNDRIRISISGGFNSSVEEALDAAIENTKVKYDWVLPIKMGQKPEK